MTEASLFVGVVGLFFGLLSIVLALQMRRMREPSYAIRSKTLVRDDMSNLEGLQIHYKGLPVTYLTISRILFWNRGWDTIHQEHVVEAIKISALEDCELLDVSILQRNNPANDFSASAIHKGKSSAMRFRYLDHNDGVVLQIVHTGKDRDSLVFEGRIIGAKRFVKRTIYPLNAVTASIWDYLKERMEVRSVRVTLTLIRWFVALYIFLGLGSYLAIAIAAMIVQPEVYEDWEGYLALGIAFGAFLLGVGLAGAIVIPTVRGKCPFGLERYLEQLPGWWAE